METNFSISNKTANNQPSINLSTTDVIEKNPIEFKNINENNTSSNSNLYNDDQNKESNFQKAEIIQIANNIQKFPSKQIKHLTNQKDIEYYLNRRIELNGYCGIIKYIGHLKHKKDSDSELWLGIEWDEEARGKHNGTVENFMYFETKNNKTSGSLIKISKVNFGLDFEEALNFKYNFEKQKNEMYAFMSSIVENEAYIQAKNKRIEIEFVGKEKAIKKYSDFKTFPRIDLGYAHLATICEIKMDLAALFPRLKELNLTRSLLSKWSEFALILLSLKNLESLNFSENKLKFDEDFFELKKILFNKENKIFDKNNKEFYVSKKIEDQNNQKNDKIQNTNDFQIKYCSVIEKINSNFSSSEEIKKNLMLKSLILNKNYLCLEDLMQISFLLPSLENFYLFDNQINEHTLPDSISGKEISEFKINIANLKCLILEKNNISNLESILCFFPYRNLVFLNLNQNNIEQLISKELYEFRKFNNQENDPKTSIQNTTNNNYLPIFDFFQFFQHLKILNLDFNKIYDYETLFNQMKYLSNLEELNILNNGFARNQKLGLENAKVNIIGRLLNLVILNHTTISKEMKRDSELFYLKNSVKEYFNHLLKGDFDRVKFDAHMKEYHPNYFILKKKYFDPVEDIIEGVKTINSNTIKGSMVEYNFIHKEKTIKRKFPKTTTFYNLKNLLMKLFKINGNYTFRIISSSLINKLKLFNFNKTMDQIEKEEHSPDEIFDITDESKPLEDFNITDKDLILLV